MKLYPKSQKYIKHSLAVARRSEKRRKYYKTQLCTKRQILLGKSKEEGRQLKMLFRYKTHIPAPSFFSFTKNPEEVIKFLNTLENNLKNRISTYVILKDVEAIDYAAITVLLSVLSMFKLKKVNFNGDYPKNPEARKLLIESGFFDYIGGRDKNEVNYFSGKDNQIITHAHKNVVSELGLPIMMAAAETIWGEHRKFIGLQSVFVELMQNTNNHASTGIAGEKHWWLSVNHDKQNKKVGFVFVDHGVGIFTSLDRKPPESKWYAWTDKIKSGIGLSSNDHYLRQLLSGELHATITKKRYRGKGLPNIKRMLDSRRIDNLHVISNNTYADVASGKYNLLENNFQGTFFYWELCQNNLNSLWNIK